ncbi:MAG: hypothetical protein ACTSPY_06355 [Candidatus Helarchaeota archaeon]
MSSNKPRFVSIVTTVLTSIILFFTIIGLISLINIGFFQSLSDRNILINNDAFESTAGELIISPKPIKTIHTAPGDLGPDIYLLEKGQNSSIRILTSGSYYDTDHYLEFSYNASNFCIGDINYDSYVDLVYIQDFITPGEIDFHFYNTSISGYRTIPDDNINTGTTASMDIVLLANFFHSGQLDVLYTYDTTLYSSYWQNNLSSFSSQANILLFTPNWFTTKIMLNDFINNDMDSDLILYGQDFTSDFFQIIFKDTNFSKFGVRYILNLTNFANYKDLTLLDMNGDLTKDILAVNDSGIFIYYLDLDFNKSINFNYAVYQTGLEKIKVGNFNSDPTPDIVVSNKTGVYIYYDLTFSNGPTPILIGSSIIVTDFNFDYYNGDDLLDIATTVFYGSTYNIFICYQKGVGGNGYEPEPEPLLIGSISASALGGISVGATFFSPPTSDYSSMATSTSTGTTTGTDTTKFGGGRSGDVKLGMKKPGKWFKRKKLKMYLSSLGIGVCLSILFLFMIYPVALSSTWLVWFGAIIGPVGFFYGVYDFIYVGLYSNKGNLWSAYYKGKTKFFWDVFSWAKPILTIWCIYTTFNMLMTLTFSNLFLSILSFSIMIGGMTFLLIVSIYVLKVDKIVEVDDLRKKSLEYIKEKKTRD